MQFTTLYSEIDNLDHFQLWFSLPVSATRFQARDHFEFQTTLSTLLSVPCPDDFRNLVLGALEELRDHVQDLPVFVPWKGYREFRETQQISVVATRSVGPTWLQLSGFCDGIEKLYSHVSECLPLVEETLKLLDEEIARQHRRLSGESQ